MLHANLSEVPNIIDIPLVLTYCSIVAQGKKYFTLENTGPLERSFNEGE